MAVTGTVTNLDICVSALRKAGVTAQDEAPTAYDIDLAKDTLDRMLKAWQNLDIDLFTVASQSVTLTTAANYTLSPVRPLDVRQVNYKSTSGIETPMIEMTREEYDSLPDKTSTGIPTSWYYDRQKENATLSIWPAMSSVSGETLEITYTREINDVALDAAADLPGEWWDAAVYGLAARLSDDYDINPTKSATLERKAAIYLDNALRFDREVSVFFASDD